jgi:hypothetical protein
MGVCLGIFAVCVASARAATPPAVPVPEKELTWRDSAQKAGLTPNDIERLARDKILVTGQSFKQVFQPYLDPPEPVFVTSDSLLNAFHVLYEESVVRMEQANARKLPGILRFLWGNLATVETWVKGERQAMAAKTRGEILIGTALTLLGEKPAASRHIARTIAAEIQKISEGHVCQRPEWLGPPDAGAFLIDYSRFRPRGFYTRTEELSRYFRAVSWLQAIHFRVRVDEELLTILALGSCVAPGRFKGDQGRYAEFNRFFSCFKDFIGQGDDWDLFTASEAAGPAPVDLSPGRLAQIRRDLTQRANERGEGPMISDQVNMVREPELGFRVLSAYRTPDSTLFTRTANPRAFLGRFPTGLEVATALGSAFARAELSTREGHKADRLLKVIEEAKPVFKGTSLYFGYLDCLAALLDEPEAKAPDFMRGVPWQAKSCQAALAGWAQLRHTWALQAKQPTFYLCLTPAPRPVGFVEPDPEFFARMGRLVERSRKLLEESGALTPDPQAYIAEFRAVADLLEKKGFPRRGMKAADALSPLEAETVEKYMPRNFWPAEEREAPEFFRDFIKRLREVAKEFEQDKEGLAATMKQDFMDLRDQWPKLSTLCERLEALARKQLEGVPLTEEDNTFLRAYGANLQPIMLHTRTGPTLDTAPRIVDVFTLVDGAPLCLEVGIGRPCAIYVLYPWRGTEILCLGAVLPYYEFKSSQRLTDEEWKTMLDSPKRPDIPGWAKPILSAEGVPKPK